MPEPTTIRELNVLFGEFRGGLERHLAEAQKGLDTRIGGLHTLIAEVQKGLERHINVLQTLVLTVLGAIAVLVAAVGGNYFHVYTVEKGIIEKIDGINQKLATLQTKEEFKKVADELLKEIRAAVGARPVLSTGQPPAVGPADLVAGDDA